MRASRSPAAAFTFQLPQEVIDLIVDELQEDTQGLKNCSLASHAFHTKTREHLFREIVIGEERNPKVKCTKLRLLLETTPTLRHHIRFFTIIENAKNHKSEYRDGWLKRQNDLPILLSFLTSLQRICIKCQPEFLNWSFVSPELKIALYDAFSSPTVVHLELENIMLMQITPLIHCHQLKHLYLNNISHDLTERDAPFPLNLSPLSTIPPDQGLEVLDVAACSSVLKTLLSYNGHPGNLLDLSNPKELWICTADFDAGMVRTWEMVLNQCTSSVERYYITQQARPPPDTDPFSSSVFAFYRLPCLRYLDINLSPPVFHWPGQNPTTILVEELRRLASQQNNLETFNFELDLRPLGSAIHPTASEEILNQLIGDAFWDDLDLTFGEGFAALSSVNIKFDLTDCPLSKRATTRSVNLIKQKLRRLSERGILNVHMYRQ